MVKYLLVNAYVFLAFLSIAQTDNKDVVITASGSGTSQELAKQTALRNAIEQAFGAFISSKTEIFNDEIVADQMSSVSSGNVKSYEVLNESQLPNGTWASTLRVIVSVDKLTTFVEAKGITVEIKGGLFALNIKQQLLNEQGEINAITEMFRVLHEVMQTAFDYTIKSGDPKSLDAESKNWEIPLTVAAIANKNMDFCSNYLIKNLAAITLSLKEKESYQSLNKKVFEVRINFNNEKMIFHLRKEISIEILLSFLRHWEFYNRNFIVNSGLEENLGLGDVIFNFKILEDKKYITLNNEEIYPIERGDTYNKINVDLNGTLTINLPESAFTVSSYKWIDKKTLEQMEKISMYSVTSGGVKSQIKNGGFIIYEEDGHGLVISVCDIAFLSEPDEAIQVCESLNFNGYNDWFLPNYDELMLIKNNLFLKKEGGIENKKEYYCLNNKNILTHHTINSKFLRFEYYLEEIDDFYIKGIDRYPVYIRAIRKF
jgi:hypothetical protein